jgi:glutamate 5-kinase
VRGSFDAGACVQCVDLAGREFARGLVSYSAADLAKIKGRHSRDIERTLGYDNGSEVIHRDDLVLTEPIPASIPGEPLAAVAGAPAQLKGEPS